MVQVSSLTWTQVTALLDKVIYQGLPEDSPPGRFGDRCLSDLMAHFHRQSPFGECEPPVPLNRELEQLPK